MTKNHIRQKASATSHDGLLYTTTPIHFYDSSMEFYSPSADHHVDVVEIDYASIVWIEKKKSLGFIPNRMVLYTKEQGEYTFSLHERDDVVAFLKSKARLSEEKPRNAKRRLHVFAGEKIRRQYLNIFIYLILSYILPIFLFLPLIETRINGNAFTASEAGELFTMFVDCMVLTLPLLLLSIINRFLFGKIVCVLDENGIHHSHGFIPWKDIERIEYNINLPRKTAAYSYCYAHIIGKGLDFRLIHAPHYLMRRAQKYQKDIKLKFSKSSLFEIILLTALPSVIYILVLIFYGA